MKKLLILLTALASSHAFAMFCPSNLNIIEIGDTIDRVLAQCGAPASQKTYTDAPNVPQEWDYYIKSNPYDQVNSKLAIMFKDNKILNITISGPKQNKLLCDAARASNDLQAIQLACGTGSQDQFTVTNTNLCGDMIQLGDDIQKVEKICGKADFISKSEQQQPITTTEITEFTYTSPMQVTLIFENGKLKSRIQ